MTSSDTQSSPAGAAPSAGRAIVLLVAGLLALSVLPLIEILSAGPDGGGVPSTLLLVGGAVVTLCSGVLLGKGVNAVLARSRPLTAARSTLGYGGGFALTAAGLGIWLFLVDEACGVRTELVIDIVFCGMGTVLVPFAAAAVAGVLLLVGAVLSRKSRAASS